MIKRVIVYSTPTCPFCVRVKNLLKDNNIEFEDIDVSIDQGRVQEMIKKSGQMGVPVVDISGEIIVGFDRERIEEILSRK